MGAAAQRRWRVECQTKPQAWELVVEAPTAGLALMKAEPYFTVEDLKTGATWRVVEVAA